jgi:hypothetical protein
LGGIQRSSPTDTLNFTIPNVISQGSIRCDVKVFDPANSASSVSTTVNLSFTPVPRLGVHGVLVHYTGVDFFDKPVDAQPTSLDFYATLDFVFRTYPIPGIDFNGFEVLPWSAKLAVTQNFNDLFGAVKNLRAMSGSSHVYVGLIPPAAGCGGTCGLGGGGSALTFAGAGSGAAHEMGHALGRQHTQCATTAPGSDPNYPTYDGFPQGSIGEVGFDSYGPGVPKTFDPRSTFDFMSYCNPVWVSPYTYLGLLNAIQATSTARQASAVDQAASIWVHPSAEFLYLHLRVHRDAAPAPVEVRSAFSVPGAPPQPRWALPTSVNVELVDADGRPVGRGACEPFDPDHDENDPFEDLFVTVPMFSEVRGIRVLRRSHVLDTLELAPEAPAVVITEMIPAVRPGFVRLGWRAEVAPEVVPLVRYELRYSHDAGKTWKGIATGLTGNHHEVNLELLPGGTACQLQVIASAGLRSSAAETDYFEVARKPRKAYIVAPEEGAQFEYGQVVVLAGGGFSPDHGAAPVEHTLWTTHSVGKLGLGHQVAVHGLPAGRHILTVHVPDGDHGEATENREIVITL